MRAMSPHAKGKSLAMKIELGPPSHFETLAAARPMQGEASADPVVS